MAFEPTKRRLFLRLKKASLEHRLIEPGDHILVCLSGGKDSYTLLSLMLEFQRHVPFAFDMTAFHLDQKQPGYPQGVMEAYLATLPVDRKIVAQDTYAVVQEKLPQGATPCSLCSRMRRGIIYTHARALGCTKIALGHHRDDSLETLLLNLFHAGQMQAMPASYTTDDGQFRVIRPLIYCAEDEIARYAQAMAFPIIPCTLCGSVEGRRAWVKSLLTHIELTVPQARQSMLAALQNVRPSHLLDLDLLERLDPEGTARLDAQDDILRLVSNSPSPG